MKKGFTLLVLLIFMGILGIISANIIQLFQRPKSHDDSQKLSVHSTMKITNKVQPIINYISVNLRGKTTNLSGEIDFKAMADFIKSGKCKTNLIEYSDEFGKFSYHIPCSAIIID